MVIVNFELIVIFLLSSIFVSVLYLAHLVKSSFNGHKQFVLNLAIEDDKSFAELKDIIEDESDTLQLVLDTVSRTESSLDDVKHVSDLVYKYKIPPSEIRKQLDEMEVENELFSKSLK